MTRMCLRRKNKINKIVVLAMWIQITTLLRRLILIIAEVVSLFTTRPTSRSYKLTFYRNRDYIRRLIYSDDVVCTEQLRMDMNAFFKLCQMLEEIGGLTSTRNMIIDEQVAMLLYVLAHHFKNRVIKHHFGRSGETVSRYFHNVHKVILRLQDHLYKKAQPVAANPQDERWKWFKNCLGALDGIYIKIRVPYEDKARYRTRNGEIATNVLGVCTPDMQFTYVFPGWEYSAADERILRDALTRQHGLKVPSGCYYLVDAGYTNCDGFLAPFRGQRYHLNEWRQGHLPRNVEELYNLRHASARNVIERCFGLLKIRWAIMRSSSFYPVRVQSQIEGGWGWRVSLALPAAPAVLMTVRSIFLPETPNSILERGHPEEARGMLKKVRGTENVDREFRDLVAATDAAKKIKNPMRNILLRKYRPQLVICSIFSFFQQVTGINVIMFYVPVVFRSLGFGDRAALMAAAITGAVNVLATVVSAFSVDMFGRRALFLEGGVQMIIYQIAIGGMIGMRFGMNGQGSFSKGEADFLLFLVCRYVAAFAWSWGPLAWMVPAEISPLEVRPAGQGINVSVNMFFTFISAQAFLAMLCRLKFGLFYFFAGFVIIMTIFVFFFVPETKNIPIEEMGSLLKAHWFWGKYVTDEDATRDTDERNSSA